MARRTFAFVQTTSAGQPLLELDQIPQEVKDEVEQIFAELQQREGRIRVEFDTKAELQEYELQVKSYCALRPAGALYYRKSPARGLGETQMDFKILAEKPVKEDKTADGGEVVAAEDGERKSRRGRKAEHAHA